MEFTHKPKNKVVLGLGYGDEGKGMAVAHEVIRALAFGLTPVVVRFNGGPQAAHNVRVVGDDGNVLHHTHSQFGSGALLGADTIITKGMLFDPFSVANEASHLSFVTKSDSISKLMVDMACPVILPIHVYANQHLERGRGKHRHGSTGRGIGIARACEHACKTGDVDPHMLIDVKSLFQPNILLAKMQFWCKWISSQYGVEMEEPSMGLAEDISNGVRRLNAYGMRVSEHTTDIVRENIINFHCVIFEGSQGLLLDRRYGTFPHVTYGDMSAYGAFEVAGCKVPVMGVTRSYQTRHGNGPFPTEGTYDAPEVDNITTTWAGKFRTGLLDAAMFKSVTSWEPVDELAVSCMDRYPGKFCGYDHEVIETGPERFLSHLEHVAQAPVTVVGYGNTVGQWTDR